MSEAFSSIKQGLTEAIEFAQGKSGEAVVHEFAPIDIKAVRTEIGMTQSEFAVAFGISLGTLRHWERGDIPFTVTNCAFLRLWNAQFVTGGIIENHKGQL